MRNFQDTFETRKRSFVSAFSICMTVPSIQTSKMLEVGKIKINGPLLSAKWQVISKNDMWKLLLRLDSFSMISIDWFLFDDNTVIKGFNPWMYIVRHTLKILQQKRVRPF